MTTEGPSVPSSSKPTRRLSAHLRSISNTPRRILNRLSSPLSIAFPSNKRNSIYSPKYPFGIFSLPAEIRELIYIYAIGHRVDFIFHSNSLAWQLYQKSQGRQGNFTTLAYENEQYDLTIPRGSSRNKDSCSVYYTISPIPRYLRLVSKQFSEELIDADRRERRAVGLEVDRNIIHGSGLTQEWRRVLSGDPTPAFLDIVKSSRFIFDCKNVEAIKQLSELPGAVRAEIREVFYTTLAMRRSLWDREEMPTDFLVTESGEKALPNLKNISIVTHDYSGTQMRRYTPDVYRLMDWLQAGAIERFELIDENRDARYIIYPGLLQEFESKKGLKRGIDYNVKVYDPEDIVDRGPYKSRSYAIIDPSATSPIDPVTGELLDSDIGVGMKESVVEGTVWSFEKRKGSLRAKDLTSISPTIWRSQMY